MRMKKSIQYKYNFLTIMVLFVGTQKASEQELPASGFVRSHNHRYSLSGLENRQRQVIVEAIKATGSLQELQGLDYNARVSKRMTENGTIIRAWKNLTSDQQKAAFERMCAEDPEHIGTYEVRFNKTFLKKRVNTMNNLVNLESDENILPLSRDGLARQSESNKSIVSELSSTASTDTKISIGTSMPLEIFDEKEEEMCGCVSKTSGEIVNQTSKEDVFELIELVDCHEKSAKRVDNFEETAAVDLSHPSLPPVVLECYGDDIPKKTDRRFCLFPFCVARKK